MGPDEVPPAPTRPPLSISLAAFVSSFDRFAISPLIVLVAHDLGATLTGVAATFAPTLSILVITRALSGAFYGAIVPTSMTYVGDTVDEANRQPALTDLMAAIAVRTASATAPAGVLAHFIDWRVVFAIPAVLAVG
ncbi:MAG: MFS transporter, partial [Brevibacterium sp.]|nr:MFS transporter [Brevibacterium sp.]